MFTGVASLSYWFSIDWVAQDVYRCELSTIRFAIGTTAMKVKGNWELVWMAIAMGAVLTSLIVVISRADRDPQAQLEVKSQRLERINAMRLALSAASEEQNCAVLSASEQASKSYLESASVEIAAFERNRSELAKFVPKRNVEIE